MSSSAHNGESSRVTRLSSRYRPSPPVGSPINRHRTPNVALRLLNCSFGIVSDLRDLSRWIFLMSQLSGASVESTATGLRVPPPRSAHTPRPATPATSHGERRDDGQPHRCRRLARCAPSSRQDSCRVREPEGRERGRRAQHAPTVFLTAESDGRVVARTHTLNIHRDHESRRVRRRRAPQQPCSPAGSAPCPCGAPPCRRRRRAGNHLFSAQRWRWQ